MTQGDLMTSLRYGVLVSGALLVGAFTVSAQREAPAARAWTIVGADVADGTGSALRRANVRIEGDRIAAIGNVTPQRGDTVVDGKGFVVSPGFIDIHNHSSDGLANDPAAATQVSQGITTLVVGPDGGSPWPLGEYLAERRRQPSTVNVASFVGHATIRRTVMGDDYKRPARPDEVARMAALVDLAMREGAVGLSSGLEYEVGGYAETSELVELSRAAARYPGAIYMSHIRDEADKSFEALREVVEIGERAKIPVQISHIKLGTVSVWHKAAEAIALVEAARKRGVDVTADEYPYNAWSSTITVLVPDKRYDYPPSVEKALADVGGAGNVLLVRHAAHPEYEFRTLDAVANERKVTPVEQFIQIVKDGGAGVVCTSMVDDDMRAFYRQPWVMVASDGGIGTRHPRGAGTFPRVLGRYVRDEKWLTLPEAIRKMTSAPADRLKLEGRGRLIAGAVADVVMFNAGTIADRSTFSDPGIVATGVEKVFVGGELVWDQGRTTAARPGKVLLSGRTPGGASGPYHLLPHWGDLPAGLAWGEVPGITIDRGGRIFAFNRAEPPVVELDASGKVLKTWGDKMFVWPHGIRIDRDGFLWLTDGRARGGIGQQVFKFTSDGRLLMTLGRKGVAGDGPDTFNSPTDVAVAPNGDIFVADGHVNSRIVKFSPDGAFIKAWGKRGEAPGEFNVPHTLFFDSRGRLLVGDRSNRRIQLFDQDGRFLEQWTQFGSPSGIFVAPDDTLYVADYNDKMRLFVGSAKDGSIRHTLDLTLAEGVAVDPQGSIYVGETVVGHLGDMITGHIVRKIEKR
jgi:N-acyl-D-amino-acid deacylase